MSVPYLGESVEEGFGKTFTPTTLSKGVLAGKHLRLFVLNLEAHAQFRYIDLSSVIKAGIQTLQDRLRGQVQLEEGETSQLQTTIRAMKSIL